MGQWHFDTLPSQDRLCRMRCAAVYSPHDENSLGQFGGSWGCCPLDSFLFVFPAVWLAFRADFCAGVQHPWRGVFEPRPAIGGQRVLPLHDQRAEQAACEAFLGAAGGHVCLWHLFRGAGLVVVEGVGVAGALNLTKRAVGLRLVNLYAIRVCTWLRSVVDWGHEPSSLVALAV